MSNGEVKYKVSLKDSASSILRRISGGFGRFFRGIKRMGGGALRMFSGLPALLAGGGIAAILGKSTHAFGIQEAATNDLRSALKLMGDETPATLKKLQAFSSELQGMSRVGDEVSQKMMALGLNLGVPIDKIEETTKAALGLSKRLGIDASAAMQLLGRMAAGGEVALSRYGITIDKSLSPQEKFNKLLEFGAEGFAAVQSDAEKTAGKFVRLKNAVGDLWERMGEAIDKAFGLGKIFDWLRERVEALGKSNLFEDWAAKAKELLVDVLAVGKAMANTDKRGAVIKGVGSLIVAAFIDGMTGAVKMLLRAMPYIGQAIAAGAKSAAGLGMIPKDEVAKAKAKAAQNGTKWRDELGDWRARKLKKQGDDLASKVGDGSRTEKAWASLMESVKEERASMAKVLDNSADGAKSSKKWGDTDWTNKDAVLAEVKSWDDHKDWNDADILDSYLKKAKVAETKKSMIHNSLGGWVGVGNYSGTREDNQKGDKLGGWNGKKKLADGVKAARSDVTVAARADWMRSVKGGKTPEEEMVDNTREMNATLKRIEKNTEGGGLS